MGAEPGLAFEWMTICERSGSPTLPSIAEKAKLALTGALGQLSSRDEGTYLQHDKLSFVSSLTVVLSWDESPRENASKHAIRLCVYLDLPGIAVRISRGSFSFSNVY
jgi:hypothetical protein